jgi:alpha-L-fucosidase
VRSLLSFQQIITQTQQINLARHAKGISQLIDGDPHTYWSPESDNQNADTILEFDTPVRFNVLGLREHLPLGQRISAFAFDTWQNGQWIQQAGTTSIGNRRLLRLPTITTNRVRLRILNFTAPAAFQELALYLEPE